MFLYPKLQKVITNEIVNFKNEDIVSKLFILSYPASLEEYFS